MSLGEEKASQYIIYFHIVLDTLLRRPIMEIEVDCESQLGLLAGR